MNRRGFLSGIIKAGVAAAILPPALTYARKWVKPSDQLIFRVHIADCGLITQCRVVCPTPEQLEEIFKEGMTYQFLYPAYKIEAKDPWPVMRRRSGFYDFVMGKK